MEILNFWGISRSGNHACINWILGHYGQNGYSVGFQNNSTLTAFSGFEYLWPFIDHARKAVLLVSYENKEMERIKNKFDVVKPDYERYNILVLRDPFNTFASRIKVLANPLTRKLDVELYLSYCREFLGETNFLRRKICINFNKWFQYQEYRRQFIEALGFSLTDINFTPINVSVFDGVVPTQKSLLNRWRVYETNSDYLKAVNDPRIVEMSKRIFNFAPMVEQ